MKYAVFVDGVVTDAFKVDPYTIFAPEYAARFVEVPDEVDVGWSLTEDSQFVPPYSHSLEARRAAAWDRVKMIRDRRQKEGVKVGANWFHSDDSSRIQQMALTMLGANMPPGLQWKTLTHTGTVFVTMTPTLAAQVFQATVMSDSAVFARAEALRLAVEGSDDPDAIDLESGWPLAFEDVA